MEIEVLEKEFKNCQKILNAMGDPTRQHLILCMVKMGRCEGVRVGEIAEKTSLSRPAASHHLGILKDAGIVKIRKEGTKNFYYFDADASAMNGLIEMLRHAKAIMEARPHKNKEEESWN